MNEIDNKTKNSYINIGINIVLVIICIWLVVTISRSRLKYAIVINREVLVPEKHNFQINETVWDIVRGKGVIVSIDIHRELIKVEFKDSTDTCMYGLDGKKDFEDVYPSLYPSNVVEKIKE